MRCNQISVIMAKPLDIPSGPSPLDLFSFLERDKTWLLSVETSWNLSLPPEIYSWKVEPLLKGISPSSLEPIVEKWSLKAFDKEVELVIETLFRLNS